MLWFRNDLRLTDNSIIHEAAKRVNSGAAKEVLPVFCFDPRWFRSTQWNNGYLKTGPFRAQFLLESVIDLKSRLRDIGSDLLIAMGPPEEILPPLAGPESSILAHSEVTSEEIRAETAVRRRGKSVGASLELFWGNSLYHIDDLPFNDILSDLPDVFTPFKEKCEKRCEIRKSFSAPRKGSLPLPGEFTENSEKLSFMPSKIEDLNVIVPENCPKLVTAAQDSRSAFTLKGGETAALERLKYYLWDTDLAADYFNIRNGMLGGDYSTKLSPALAHGCISAGKIAEEVSKYEEQRTANKSTYWIKFELTWRDFFRYQAIKHGNAIFMQDGLVASRGRTWSSNPDLLQKWKEGKTGFPLVDANMRELAATGWMSNRGRQNVASFFALDLGLDWRIAGDWFESLLLDYDVASNWGNWVAAAGLNGGRVNKFNITKQSKDYDPDGKYIRHWCPELAKVPASRIHEPWLMSKQEQDMYECQIGVDYPQAIPASNFAGRSSSFTGGSGQSGRVPSRFGNNNGSRGGGNNRRGGGRGGEKRQFRAKSAFEIYG